MKTKCLDDFYESLKKDINQEISEEIEKLIKNNDFNEENLSNLIIKEVEK